VSAGGQSTIPTNGMNEYGKNVPKKTR
jgi:hypothetical protein